MVPGVHDEGGMLRKKSPQVELQGKVRAQAQETKLSSEGWMIVEGEPLGKREKSRNKVEENKTCTGDEKKPNLLVIR